MQDLVQKAILPSSKTWSHWIPTNSSEKTILDQTPMYFSWGSSQWKGYWMGVTNLVISQGNVDHLLIPIHFASLGDTCFSKIIPYNDCKQAYTKCCKDCCSNSVSSEKKVRKETRYFCSDCDKELCEQFCAFESDYWYCGYHTATKLNHKEGTGSELWINFFMFS